MEMLEGIAILHGGERRQDQRFPRSAADRAQQSDELHVGDPGAGGGVRQLESPEEHVDRRDRAAGERQGGHRRLGVHADAGQAERCRFHVAVDTFAKPLVL